MGKHGDAHLQAPFRILLLQHNGVRCHESDKSSSLSDERRDRICGLTNLFLARNSRNTVAILRPVAAKLSVAAAIQHQFLNKHNRLSDTATLRLGRIINDLTC